MGNWLCVVYQGWMLFVIPLRFGIGIRIPSSTRVVWDQINFNRVEWRNALQPILCYKQ